MATESVTTNVHRAMHKIACGMGIISLVHDELEASTPESDLQDATDALQGAKMLFEEAFMQLSEAP